MPTFRQDEKLGTKVPLIKTADFNDKSVTTEKLAEGSVTNSKLAPESVTQDKFDKELLQIFEAAAGLPENLIETIQNVDSTLIDHQRQISSNDDDISDLQTKTKQIKDTVDGIAVSGGASVGSAVTYDNTQSGLDAQNIQNAIDELVNNLGHYETNEEWLRVYTDAENKFLWGIRVDGSIDWAVGIPKPIQKALNEIIANNETFQQTLTEAMEAYKATIDEKVAAIDKKKVDKEEGKSLIEDEVKERFRVIENEEFIKAVVDSEDRVLFGFYRATGEPYYPLNEMYHVIQNEEFLWVILDAANHPLLGIQQDGTSWAAKAQWLDDIKAIKNVLSNIDETLKTFQPKEDGKGLINIDVADSFFYISNDEYIIAVEDAENRILAGIKYDGEPYFPNHEMYSVIANEEWLYAIIDAENKVLGGFRADDGHMVVGGIDISTFIANAIIDIADIKKRTAHLSTIINDEYLSIEIDADGKVIGYIAPDGSHYLYKVKSETIPEEFSHIEDPEGRTEIVTDAEDNVLAYRDSDGIRHENGMEVEQFYQKGNKIEYATKNYVDSKPIDDSEIVLSKLDGVVDYSLENLFDKNKIRTYDSDFATKVFNAIGRKTGATGCYSNNIPCKEGDWFTRNDFGTGIVVVLDKNDNILGDVRNVAYKPTFQIKASENQDFSKAVSVVMVVMLNALDTERIVNAKYVPSKEEDAIRIPKLKVGQENIELGITTYVKGSSGRYYSLNVEDLEGSPQINLVKLEGIPSSELPSDFPKFTISGSFSDYYKSLVLCPIEGGTEYLLELGTNGLVSRYLKKKVNCPRLIKENGVQYYYGVDGNLNSSNGELNIYKAKDETFEEEE
jgi:hypothetical protein